MNYDYKGDLGQNLYMNGKFGILRPADLLAEDKLLVLATYDHNNCIELGEIAKSFSVLRNLPIAVEVRLGDWIIYHASLPGSTPENDWWISRKARTVVLKHHSTMYERVSAEERGVDWHIENNLLDETHAIHGGGLPLITKNEGFVGVFSLVGCHRWVITC